MKILIISDAWGAQVNGVVRTLTETARCLEQAGHDVLICGPVARQFCTFPIPFYREIKMEVFAHKRIVKIIDAFAPDFIHIATEGPLGWAARRLCLQRKRNFTTSYHTRFPDYLAARVPRLLAGSITTLAYVLLRHFHAPATVVMVPTPSIERELCVRKFYHLVRWSRGVDMNMFRPYAEPVTSYENLPRPLLLYVGRVAVEKNLRAFLDVATTGSKIVIGDGPHLALLRRAYPQAHFLGGMKNEALARHYAAADLFVFPSMTDTFGLVLLEACAAGLRIAAYPAPGPVDIFAADECRTFAVIAEKLQDAVDQALALPDTRKLPRDFARHFSWAACTRQFLAHLQAQSPQGFVDSV